tara:strand:- start:90 stop:494 length:405 start_codon:yes stop_codon:yes gene_type:complete
VAKHSNKINPFDFVKSVSYDKNDLMVDEVAEKSYQPFLVNKSLSYHQDTIYLTNEMNVRHSMDNRLQYLFFLNTIRKRKRFSKWHKPYESKKLDTVKNYFGVSTQKAKEYLEILNDKQYRELKNSMKTGGKNNG